MSNASSPGFINGVDPQFEAERSIVLRYRNALRLLPDEAEDAQFKQLLGVTSMREGARIFHLVHYHGVDIHVLDETSLMHTGSLKSIDGSVTTAMCRLRGHERVVFESGGNTGTALTAYAIHAGIETFCFIPEDNLPLLDSRTFADPRAHLITVDEPGRVKRSARLFGRLNGAAHIPETPWRYLASQFRGCFILEHLLKHGSFDWLVQTISAAFGPIGIYRVLERHLGGGRALPRLLGIQQESNCPMYRAWKSGSAYVVPKPVGSTTELLSRVMYDSAPHTYGTYEDLRQLLVTHRGDLTTVGRADFDAFLGDGLDGRDIFDALRAHGIDIPRQSIDKTGLIAMSATLREIRRGTIPEGSRVLCCVTAGTAPADGRAKPDLSIRRRRSRVA